MNSTFNQLYSPRIAVSGVGPSVSQASSNSATAIFQAHSSVSSISLQVALPDSNPNYLNVDTVRDSTVLVNYTSTHLAGGKSQSKRFCARRKKLQSVPLHVVGNRNA